MTAKRPGDDAVGGEFKKPRVEVSVLRRAYKFQCKIFPTIAWVNCKSSCCSNSYLACKTLW